MFRGILFFTLAASFLTPVDVRASQFTKVAIAGDAAPGTQADVVFSTFGEPTINASGHVAFAATLQGPGISDSINVSGIWVGPSDQLQLVARSGDPAVGVGAGNDFLRFRNPFLNDRGDLGFAGTYAGPTTSATNNDAIWTTTPGLLTLVARESGGTELAPDVIFSEFNFTNTLAPPIDLRFDSLGRVAFQSRIEGPGIVNRNGIWSNLSGLLAPLIREGDPAPGSDATAIFDSFTTLALGDNGHVVFKGILDSSSISSNDGNGLWLIDGGTLQAIAIDGTPAPGTEPGVVYSDFDFDTPITINTNGWFAFAGIVKNNVESSRNSAIWSGQAGSIALIAREGDQAPGTPSGVVFDDLRFGNNTLVINGNNKIAVTAELMGSGVTSDNDTGIWIQNNSALELVVREGEQVPGLGPNSHWGGFSGPKMNINDNIVFTAFLRGDVTSKNDRGIWFYDGSTILQIVREGEMFDVNAGIGEADLREITKVTLTNTTGSGGEDAMQSSFNDSDQVAFILEFKDGSQGIFMATVPEPSTLLLTILLSMFVLRGHRTKIDA